MKGSQAIFQSLFQNDPAPEVQELPLPERKGRSEALKIRQNEKIVHRYYYYVKVQERQYEKAIDLLQEEFDLARRTLIDIISRNTPLLKQLAQTKPDLKYFRAKYSYLTWVSLYQ